MKIHTLLLLGGRKGILNVSIENIYLAFLPFLFLKGKTAVAEKPYTWIRLLDSGLMVKVSFSLLLSGLK